MVRRRDQPLFLHLLDQSCGFVIADRQFALDVGGGAFAVFDHHLHGGVIKRVFTIGIAAKAQHRVDVAFFILGRPFDHATDIVGLTELLEVVDDLFDLFVADEGAVATGDLGPARHIEHVAHAQQLLGTHLTQNRAAVDFRGHLEGNPRGEVRLDRAGDNID